MSRCSRYRRWHYRHSSAGTRAHRPHRGRPARRRAQLHVDIQRPELGGRHEVVVERRIELDFGRQRQGRLEPQIQRIGIEVVPHVGTDANRVEWCGGPAPLCVEPYRRERHYCHYEHQTLHIRHAVAPEKSGGGGGGAGRRTDRIHENEMQGPSSRTRTRRCNCCDGNLTRGIRRTGRRRAAALAARASPSAADDYSTRKGIPHSLDR